jgi:calcium-dependent protein kinase
MSSKHEQEELYKTFKALDVNGDGRISKSELIEGYKNIYGNKMDMEHIIEEAEKAFSRADQDGSGEIEYTEW